MTVWPAKARHWEFLRPHFERLRGRLATHHDARAPYSHAVRVGVDVTDWWVTVSLDGLADGAALARLREALLVVGAFAQLQRECCLQYLQTFSLWRRAPFVDLEDARFRPRFRVDVAPLARGPDADPQRVRAALAALLGSDQDGADENGTSAGFVSDWARVLDMQDRVGGAAIDLEPVELFLDVDPAGVADAIQPVFLRSLRDAIRTIQAAHYERGFVPFSERLALEPAFTVRAMDLDLTGAVLAVATMDELRELVALGVPLETVEFPIMTAFPRDDVKWRFAWCELLCAIVGVASATPHSVRRLVVPSEYVRGPLLSSMFSALVFANRVGELQLGRLVTGAEMRDTETHRDTGHDGPSAAVLEAVDPNFWYWLACVLLPEDSFSSPRPIETVSLLGARIHEAAMGTLETVARTKPAIRHVAQALVPGFEVDRAPLTGQLKTVSISAGTVLSLHNIHGTMDVTTDKTVTATVVEDGSSGSAVVVIVPGLGVCLAAKEAIPEKRARTMANNSSTAPKQTPGLKNLKFIAPHRGSQSLPVLKRLLRLVGPSLEGLSVSTQRMNDRTVASFLQICPNLESLSITGAGIASLDFLWEAYARGCKISSLEFATDPSLSPAQGWQLERRIALDDSALESLLYQLMSHQTATSKTLTRLSLVRADLSHRHCPLVDDMLAHNQSLTHFWYVGCRSFGFSGRWTHERHHGELLRDTIPLGQRQRLAFLSVLRQYRQGSDTFQVDSFVGSSIFQFAATRQRRSVVRSFK